MSDFFLSTKARLFDEGGLKDLFDHVRNLLMAALIVAAGSYAIRRGGAVDLFGVLFDELVGFIVLAIGVLLAILNALSGIHQLNKQRLHLGVRILAVGFYVVATVRLIQLVVVFRTGESCIFPLKKVEVRFGSKAHPQGRSASGSVSDIP